MSHQASPSPRAAAPAAEASLPLPAHTPPPGLEDSGCTCSCPWWGRRQPNIPSPVQSIYVLLFLLPLNRPSPRPAR